MKRFIFTIIAGIFACVSFAQVNYGGLAPLHQEGNYLYDSHGNRVVLHGVMDTPSPYFNSYRWGSSATSANISSCVNYFNKLFTAMTQPDKGTNCNLFRLHLDPCWTNDNNVNADGFTTQDGNTIDPLGQKVSGEADVHHYSGSKLTTYMKTVYWRIAQAAMNHGMYVIMRPPGVCPEKIKVGTYYQDYLLDVWDRVTKNDSIRKYSGQISIELANEPVTCLDANGADNYKALHDFFQPIVDKIRANGFTGMIWVPGTGWQSNYRAYAQYPITSYNIGYAVHDYAGWYNTSDGSYNHETAINSFAESVPVVYTNPIVITEVDWSPKKAGTGHYNEHGEWVESNYGTWATGTTSKWGSAYKATLDHFGNISMTLSGTACYIDIDEYIKKGKIVPAFKAAMEADGLDPMEASGVACWKWYEEYAKVDYPCKAYNRTYTSDLGNGKYINPVINADFPDPDVIRVGDTFYMVSTTMYHFPGATILKSKDLVNWEYCANPLTKIDNNNAYNLLNGAHHYSQGQWASSLKYHNGKFYLYFICYGRSGVDNTQQILLTATNPEGTWSMTKMNDHYYDSGWLFDDGENGDGNCYVACGIGDIWVNKLDATTLEKKDSKCVLSLGNGLEGCHMYHIGDYYYIYATYGGTEGSQTIFRSKTPMGTYEEYVGPKTSSNPKGRLFGGQKIHQGALVDTPTGEWWTILFKDAGAIGRVPYLEPVTWTDGWPILGNSGIDVSANNKPYAKPNVGTFVEPTQLPTNDCFVSPELGMQWEWNHNPVESKYSLTDNKGNLRLYTANVTDNLNSARNSLSQRIIGYRTVKLAASSATVANIDCYGTISMDISNMANGDVAGLSVFQNPYSLIAVKMVDGKKYLYSERCTFNSQTLKKEESMIDDTEITADTIYLRAIVNFGTNACNYYYSYDNATWTKWGCTMTMGYTLDYFVGQRFYIFNYATEALGGYVDIDWFSTEPTYSEDRFYSPERLVAMSKSTACEKRKPSELFLLKEGEFNPTLNGSGSAKPISSYYSYTSTTSGGFGGWHYDDGVDISDYRYLVVTLGRASTKSPSFRIYDKNNFWSSPYEAVFANKAKTIVIDLQQMVNADGESVNPAHIYYGGIYQKSPETLYISSVFLSNDGVTPAPDPIIAVPGDVDGDGEVSITDVTLLIDAYLEGSTAENFDIDGDGSVSISDVTALIDIYLAQ